jgi:AcrR family transcriptional regulator
MVSRDDITETAFRLFAGKGFHETTMENIADTLGLKKQSLYSHFKNKDEIILCVLSDQARQLSEEIDLIITEHTDKPADMLLKSVFTRLAAFFSHRDRLLLWKRILFLDTSDELKDFMENNGLSFHRQLLSELGRILRPRYPKFSDEEVLSSFFLSYMILVQGYLDWMLIAGFDVNTVESAWDSCWNGVKSYFYRTG